MVGVSLTQLYVVVPPVLDVVKLIDVELAPLHTTWLAGSLTCPVGFTVIVKVCAGPVQFTDPLLKVGVTVIVATTGDVPVLIAVNEAMLPVPDANSQCPELTLTHV